MANYDDTATVSGSVVSFADGADEVPCKSCVVTVSPTLSGVSSVTETQTGKNIYDKNAGVYDDTYFNQDGTTTHYADVAVSWIRVKPNTKYTFSLGATPSRSTFLRWINCDKDKNFISRPVATYGSQNFPYTVTTPNDCQWVQLAINEYPAAQVSSNDWIIQIEENSSATAYEAYNSTTYTASLGRTIYGGDVDVVQGTGTETYARVKISDLTWTKQTSGNINYFISDVSGMDATNSKDLVCDVLTYCGAVSVALMPDKSIAQYSWNNRTTVRIRDEALSDATELINTYGNGYIVYPLATPTDFTFTGQEVPTRLGYNAFWSDSGDTELTYYKDGYGFTSVTVNKTGKNLLPNNIENGLTGGITYTKNIDGSISCSGTVTNINSTRLVSTVKLPVGNYILHGADSSIALRATLYDSDGTVITNRNDTGNGVTVSIDSSVSYVEFRIKARTNAEEVSTTVYPMLETGSTSSAYEEYSGVSQTAKFHRIIYGGQADVVKGTCEPKNLLKNELVSQTVNGTTFTTNSDGSITVSGTPSTQTRVYISKESITIGGSMFFSFGTMPTGTRVFCSRTSSGSTTYPTISPSHSATDGATYTNFLLEINTTFGGSEFTIFPQLEKGSSASEYVPHFDSFSFTPISMSTDEGENTLFANEGASAITYRKETD